MGYKTRRAPITRRTILPDTDMSTVIFRTQPVMFTQSLYPRTRGTKIHQLQNLYNKMDTRLRGYDERCSLYPKEK